MSLTQACSHPKSHQPAQMAELVDALASGASARKGVEVRVLFWAPLLRFTPSGTVRKHPQKPAKAGFLLGSLCPEPVHPRACGEQNAIAPRALLLARLSSAVCMSRSSAIRGACAAGSHDAAPLTFGVRLREDSSAPWSCSRARSRASFSASSVVCKPAESDAMAQSLPPSGKRNHPSLGQLPATAGQNL